MDRPRVSSRAQICNSNNECVSFEFQVPTRAEMQNCALPYGFCSCAGRKCVATYSRCWKFEALLSAHSRVEGPRFHLVVLSFSNVPQIGACTESSVCPRITCVLGRL